MPSGGLISVAVLIPNILWVLFPSSDVSVRRNDGTAQPPRALVFVEQVARLGVFAVPFFYGVAPLQPIERAALVVLFAALGVYYLCWFRYFTRGRSIGLLYQPLVGVPVPMAVTPVIYFVAASVVLHSSWLAAATVLLALSHVPLSQREARGLLTTPLASTGMPAKPSQ